MENQILTKSIWKDIFNRLGIEHGSVVCVQGNISRFGTTIDEYRAIIDALVDIVGKGGCVMAPTFTYSCLDPSTKDYVNYPYESWKVIREEMKGYSPKLTPSNLYEGLTNQLLKYPGVLRSDHPVYNFAYLGKVDEHWTKQTMDYPISFKHVLKPFASHNAFNLLLDLSKDNSILIPAIASTMNYGITEIQRAYINKGKSVQLKTYLNLKVDPEYKLDIMDMLKCKSIVLNGQPINCITLDND